MPRAKAFLRGPDRLSQALGHVTHCLGRRNIIDEGVQGSPWPRPTAVRVSWWAGRVRVQYVVAGWWVGALGFFQEP